MEGVPQVYLGKAHGNTAVHKVCGSLAGSWSLLLVKIGCHCECGQAKDTDTTVGG